MSRISPWFIFDFFLCASVTRAKCPEREILHITLATYPRPRIPAGKERKALSFPAHALQKTEMSKCRTEEQRFRSCKRRGNYCVFSQFWVNSASANLVVVHNKLSSYLLHGDFAKKKGCIWKRWCKDTHL